MADPEEVVIEDELIPEEVAEEVALEPVDAPTDDVMAKAIAQGYNPDYTGPNAKTPAEFLEFGDKRTPVLKERNDALFAQVKNLEGKIDQFQNQYIEGTRKAREDERAKTIKELEGRQRQAAADGEMEEFDRLGNAIKTESAKPLDVPKIQEQQPLDPDFFPWHAENKWYQKDVALTGAADAIGESLLRRNPGLQGKAFYAEVERQVRLEFPHKFNGGKPDHPIGTQRNTPVRKPTTKNTWDDIPAADRQDAITQIGPDAMFADKAAYTKKYFELYPTE